jgi:hypothetical protein
MRRLTIGKDAARQMRRADEADCAGLGGIVRIADSFQPHF